MCVSEPCQLHPLASGHRGVEEAVRAAGGFTLNDHGVELMRKAFNENNGPLRDKAATVPERQGVSNMFAGVFGAYKNSQSHRTVGISPEKAREIVVMASHLLRIVDERRPR